MDNQWVPKKKKKIKSTFKDLICGNDFLPVNLDFEIKGQHERGKKKGQHGRSKPFFLK